MSVQKFFQNISVNPKDVTDLKDLIPLSIDQDEDFQRFVNLKKVKNGDPVAFLGLGDEVGIAGSGCDPVYQEYGIANSQKRWELGDWQIPLKICYESLQATIAEYTLKTGTDIGDLTSTEFMSYILRPALEYQMKRMIWRFGWFGDKGAKKQANGGILTDDDNLRKELFTTCDGLFKRIFAQCAANSKQRTTIAANSEPTFNAQRAAMLQGGVATNLVDMMLMDADSRITSDPGAVILMTKAMADALTYDIKQTYKQIMPWQTVFQGLDVAEYNGVKIARVSIWDRMIMAYEHVSAEGQAAVPAVVAGYYPATSSTSGAKHVIADDAAEVGENEIKVGSVTSWQGDGQAPSVGDYVVYKSAVAGQAAVAAQDKPNKPYRMVFANTNTQLQIGTESGGLLEDLDIWFDKKERRNYIYATGKIGTQILEDDMFHAAY